MSQRWGEGVGVGWGEQWRAEASRVRSAVRQFFRRLQLHHFVEPSSVEGYKWKFELTNREKIVVYFFDIMNRLI